MTATGNASSTESVGRAGPIAARRARWIGEQYADITKLREIAARQDRSGGRATQRATRLNTKIEKLRHQSTVLREKSQHVLAEIPPVEQRIKQYERDVEATGRGSDGPSAGSDVTALSYRIRKLQQKVADYSQKSKALELRAATKTQRMAELKVKADRYVESARFAEAEATAYRQRADRLQLVAEQDVATHLAQTAAPAKSPIGDEPPGTL